MKPSNELIADVEQKELEAWGFLDEYVQHKTKLVILAKSIFKIVIKELQRKPQPLDCVLPYQKALASTELFTAMFRHGKRRHLFPEDYPEVANKLARYVLETDWEDISEEGLITW